MRLAALLLASSLLASPAAAQTVRSIANRGACSTSGVEGLSRQLAEQQMCLRPGGFVRFAPHPNITLSSARVHPFAQASAANAIMAAASTQSLTINSAFRTVADQYVLYHSGGCGLAARPGRSNHQSGRAIDVQNHSAARSELTGAGCAWFGASDAVHFDCPGTDMRSDSVRAFQRLWNMNNPSDMIAEDGLYGSQTESRLAQAPAGGFAMSGCAPMTCTARCDGDGYVDAACERHPCAATEICEDARCLPPTRMPEGSAIGFVYVEAGPDDMSVRVPMASVRVVETGDAVTADASGQFQLETGPGTFTLEASAEGYRTATRECVVTDDSEPTWCSIGLSSVVMETGIVRGVVYDERRGITERVVNARVTVAGTDQAVDVSPADGSFGFEVPPGEYVVEAEADGAAPGAVSCLVLAGDSSWCSIGVRAEGDADLITVSVDDPIPDNGMGMPTEPEGPGRDAVGGCGVAPAGSSRAGSALGGAWSGGATLWLMLVLGWRRRRGASRRTIDGAAK